MRGIQQAPNRDPANVIAFVTGLTFVHQGQFTGTITPLLAAAVPAAVAAAILPGSRAVQV